MSDARWMRLALSLGKRGMGRTGPNPAVGCVLVRNGRVVGRGRTADGGRPHAEVAALAQAGEAARGATAYVTLEPCNHHGKTGPCAEALIAAGVARVVIAARDPNPVAEGGVERLRAAGVVVETGLMEDEARRDLAGFLSRIERGRPFVTLKLATSFDGRIATASGESQWITGPAARRYVHGMRMRSDAVMVGGGPARDDGPSLTVRGVGPVPQPARVVLSRGGDIPLESALVRSAREVPVLVFYGDDIAEERRLRLEEAGVGLLDCKLEGRYLDLGDVLEGMGDSGFNRVFCEGGSAVAASLLAGGLVDELVTMTAGLALGAEGTPALGALGIGALSEASRFVLRKVTDVGGDVVAHWVPRDAAAK